MNDSRFLKRFCRMPVPCYCNILPRCEHLAVFTGDCANPEHYETVTEDTGIYRREGCSPTGAGYAFDPDTDSVPEVGADGADTGFLAGERRQYEPDVPVPDCGG